MLLGEESIAISDKMLRFGFSLHDVLSDFLAKYLKQVKLLLLIVAHLTLFGFLFPQFGKEYGSMARNVLIVILLVSPFSKILRMRFLFQIMALRRELGILFGYLAIVHGMSFVLDPDWFSVFIAENIQAPWRIVPTYLFGMIALTLTLPLLITSNNISVRFLKGNWKRVHYLVYPMLAFVILHNFYPPESSVSRIVPGLAQAIIVFGLYVIIRVWAHRNTTPMIFQNAIGYVSERYKKYKL